MLKPADIAKGSGQLTVLDTQKLVPLPAPYDDVSSSSGRKAIYAGSAADASFDGFAAIGIRRPETPKDEQRFVEAFISGLNRLLSADNNWPFLRQLRLSLDHCARCQTCIDSCPVYEASGYDEAYRPTFRSEIIRRLMKQYSADGNRTLAWLRGEAIELNATTLCRLLESAYRCTLCTTRRRLRPSTPR